MKSHHAQLVVNKFALGICCLGTELLLQALGATEVAYVGKDVEGVP